MKEKKKKKHTKWNVRLTKKKRICDNYYIEVSMEISMFKLKISMHFDFMFNQLPAALELWMLHATTDKKPSIWFSEHFHDHWIKCRWKRTNEQRRKIANCGKFPICQLWSHIYLQFFFFIVSLTRYWNVLGKRNRKKSTSVSNEWKQNQS